MHLGALIFAAALLWALGAPAAAPATRIAFGSCAHQGKAQPIWDRIGETRPDLFLFLGDNIYGDTNDMGVLRRKYAILGAKPEFAAFRRAIPIFAIWDDHDYGVNDGGSEYPMKRESQRIFLEFFEEPKASPRWTREGIYDARVYGTAPHRVQVILLDMRYHRDPLRVEPGGLGYIPDPDPAKSHLGEAQWRWLRDRLSEPAEVRLIGSSIQVMADAEGNPHEKWFNFPLEREKLFRTIAETRAKGVVFVSGDMHYGEIARFTPPGVDYPLHEVTASGLTHSEAIAAENPSRHRLEAYDESTNFGTITVTWDADPRLDLTLHDAAGRAVRTRDVRLSTLSAK